MATVDNADSRQQGDSNATMLAWFAGRRLPTIQSAFTKLIGELLQWL